MLATAIRPKMYLLIPNDKTLFWLKAFCTSIFTQYAAA